MSNQPTNATRPRSRRLGRRAALIAIAGLALGATAGAPAASAHGVANCTGDMHLRGTMREGTCTFPFQGFPIGIAGMYDADDPARKAEIHVELEAVGPTGYSQPLGVECEAAEPGVTRCQTEYNPFGNPLSLPEALPLQIVALRCNAHSHSLARIGTYPTGRFACWSTDEARDDLVDEGWFDEAGF